jgi:hypothetical protein
MASRCEEKAEDGQGRFLLGKRSLKLELTISQKYCAGNVNKNFSGLKKYH